MQVRTIKAHTNGFGRRFQKAVGDTYEAGLDEARRLIKFGLVEAAQTTPPPKRRAPARKKAVKNG